MSADAVVAIVGLIVAGAELITVLLIARSMAREGLLTLTLKRGQARPPAPQGDSDGR